MPRARHLLFYIIVIGACLVSMYVIVERGAVMEHARGGAVAPAEVGYWQQFKTTYHENLTHPLAILLLQILTIIVVARVFGFVFQKLGLQSVVGEIAAGIFLGPSFMAEHWPQYSAFLFPAASISNLQFLAQIGLILFMFVVGMELNLSMLRNSARDAVVVSHSAIAFSFTLGVGLAYVLFERFAPQGMHFLSFALFVGISLSVTAFPVLARIIQERGLSKTPIGTLAITCAAVDDITAWCMLAAVIAIAKAGSIVSSLYTILMAVVYVAIMLRLIRPFMKKLGDVYADRDSLSKPVVAVFFLTLLASAYTAEVIGIHALFGAFMAGVIMPPNLRFRSIFIEKVEDVAVVLLLPLFFVYTGLRTEIGLLDDADAWKVCAAITVTAVAGKFLGGLLSARFVGRGWRESLMLGALMNTRGLMELVVLNIGYDLGVLKPELFAMMVVMALVTTTIAGPTLSLIERLLPERGSTPMELEERARRYRVLVPFGDPERGGSMLRVALALVRRNPNADLTAMHLTPGAEFHQFNIEERENASFRAVHEEAAKAGVAVGAMYRASADIDRDVVNTANSGGYDLAIIGAGRSIYEGTLLGRIVGITSRIINPERLVGTLTGKEKLFETAVFDDRVRDLVREIKVPLGIYVDKDLEAVRRVVVPLFTLSDSFLLAYAQKLVTNNAARIVLLDTGSVFDQSPELLATVRGLEQHERDQVVIRRSVELESSLAELDKPDLMLISIDAWTRAVEARSPWLSRTPSVLIMRP